MRRLSDLLLLLPLAACYVAIGRLNPELAPQIPEFLGFLAAFVVLPAVGLGGLLVRKPLSLAERLALGSPAALALLFCLAYGEAALRFPWFVWLQPALGLAACLLSALKARRASAASADGDASVAALPATPWPDLALMLAVLSIALALCLPKMAHVSIPAPDTLVDYYTDDISMAGYTYAALRAMEKGLPVLQPGLAGMPLAYHLVYHFCYASCVQVTALHPLDLTIFLFPPVLWLFLAGAVVTGCRRLAGFSVLETVLAALLMLFSAGYGFSASHTVQLFSYQHTYFFGLSAFVLFLCLMYGYLSDRSARVYPLFGGICFFAAAGSKANLILLLPLGLLPVFVQRFFHRQLRLPEVALAGLCGLSVLALRAMLYTNTARATLHNPRLGKIFMGSLDTLWGMGIVVGLYLVLAVLAAEASPPLRAKLDRARQYHLFAGTFILVSAVLLKTFNFVGGDFYFFWHSRLVVVLAFAPVAAHILTWRTPRFVPVLLLALTFGLVFAGDGLLPNDSPNDSLKDKPQDLMLKVVDHGEREGLRWAADNIDHSRTFFTNKDHYYGYYHGGYIRLYLLDYLGLSGMQGFAWPTTDMEGEMLQVVTARVASQQKFLEAKTPAAAAEALADVGADYYVHCVRMGAVAVPEGLREVHRTPSLVIYENTYRKAARP